MADLVTLLRTAGLKVTMARIRVLGTLLAAAQPLSHAEIENQLPEADRVTIYRVLDSLVANGLALKAVDVRGVFRFSGTGAPREHQSHVHFRCVDCGGVFCLAAAPPPPPKLPRGFRLANVEFDLRGVCAGCARSSPAT